MTNYKQLTAKELNKEYDIAISQFNEFKNENLHIDMTRGKPCKEQLDLSMKMMDVLSSTSNLSCEDGIDCRNYGVLDGIEECKRLLGDIIEVDAKNIIIFGNSSLRVMYDCIAHSYIKGVCGETPWSKLEKVKWLCVVPGYDRHFSICEYFGMEMINIPLKENGPDMDLIQDLISKDESIKGIWCVTKYSNPDGISYSDEIVKKFANLTPKARDFRIYWDNAYSVHHLYDDDQEVILEILNECKKAGNPDLVYKFTSTSKISFPGSGIAALATSDKNKEDILKNMSVQTIGYDKVNQLRHVRFFKNLDGINEQMKKHADILRPKFELVENILEENLAGLDICHFTKPKGGYFISLYTLDGCAKRVYELCKEVGVKLTPVGAAFPYHKDPNDNNLRLAPSYPDLKDLEKASKVLATCIKIASIEMYIHR